MSEIDIVRAVSEDLAAEVSRLRVRVKELEIELDKWRTLVDGNAETAAGIIKDAIDGKAKTEARVKELEAGIAFDEQYIIKELRADLEASGKLTEQSEARARDLEEAVNAVARCRACDRCGTCSFILERVLRGGER